MSEAQEAVPGVLGEPAGLGQGIEHQPAEGLGKQLLKVLVDERKRHELATRAEEAGLAGERAEIQIRVRDSFMERRISGLPAAMPVGNRARHRRYGTVCMWREPPRVYTMHDPRLHRCQLQRTPRQCSSARAHGLGCRALFFSRSPSPAGLGRDLSMKMMRKGLSLRGLPGE